MDSFRQDSAYTGVSGLSQADFEKMTSDERATHRSWRRTVLALYCSVLLLGGFAILVSGPASNREMAQVMPAANVP